MQKASADSPLTLPMRTSQIATRPGEASDKTGPDRVFRDEKHYRDVCGRCLSRHRSRIICRNHSYASLNQFASLWPCRRLVAASPSWAIMILTPYVLIQKGREHSYVLTRLRTCTRQPPLAPKWNEIQQKPAW